MKTITILGSTGSVGRQALEVVEKFPEYFKIRALTGWENIEELLLQIKKFRPEYVGVKNKNLKEKLKKNLNFKVEILSCEEGINRIAKIPVDICIVSTCGISGLFPTLSALEKSKRVILANKEVIVVAGKIVLSRVKKYRTEIIPADSEHSAIFQCLKEEKGEHIDRIILTCSGGAFLNLSKQKMKYITPSQALKHPVWKMGKKITVDSATLMNKGFEIIEAMHFFGVPLEKIDVVVHPQSIIHSLVKFKDGSYIAQLSHPDMRLPLQYALFYPERICQIIKDIDFSKLNLTFESVPEKKFPCLELARYAARKGGNAPAILNAADEIAVELFLKGKIKFTDIPKLIEKALNTYPVIKNPSVEDIKKTDEEVKRYFM